MFKRFKKTYTKCYMLNKDNVGGYQIVKVLNEYKTGKEAKYAQFNRKIQIKK